MNREDIYSALFSLLSSAADFVTASRRVQLWSDVPPSSKPALFLYEGDTEYVRGSEAVPQKVTLSAQILIYTSNGKDPNVIPATQLNDLMDAIDTVLAPSPVTGLQTLGGLVSHCWIEGKVIVATGDLDGNGLAVIPIKMLVPT